MALFTMSKSTMPSEAEALPGRDAAMAVPERHAVNGAPLVGPFPAGLEQAVFGLGCFWGAERKFWQQPGVFTTAVGYAGGFTKNPTYEEVCSGRTGHTEVVLVVFDPRVTSYEQLLKTFWENHNPTQGMRQGNDVGTQYRSAIYTFSRAQREAAERTRTQYRGSARRARLRRDHHRSRRCAAVLLRRGVPPAVSAQESQWILRHWGHRCDLWVAACCRFSARPSGDTSRAPVSASRVSSASSPPPKWLSRRSPRRRRRRRAPPHRRPGQPV